MREVTSRSRTIGWWPGVAVAVVAGLTYLLLGNDQQGTDSHSLFARAFLDGRLHIEGSYPWLELVPRDGGGWYSPFPPLLSVALMPFEALGIEVDTNQIAALMGGVAVALMWVVLARLGVRPRIAVALTVALAFGSQLFWTAAEGGHHLAPQVTAAALLAGAIVLGQTRRAPWLAGLLLGAAAAARLPVGLALPLILWLYRPPGPGQAQGQPQRRVLDHPWLRVLAGVAVPAIVVAAYNSIRFGSVAEFGYGLIRNEAGESVLDEPWYSDGIVSLSYLPRGLHAMLFHGLELQAEFPWFYAAITGVSVLLTMPILWWVLDARGRLALVSAVAVGLVMLPNLLHGNPGFAQTGYRFIVDALPVLWLMLGLAFRDSLSRAATVALGFGIVVNVWISAAFWVGVGA